MLKPLQLALDLFGDLAQHVGRARARPTPPVGRTAQAPAGFVYELRQSERRRSLSIEVHPDLRVVVAHLGGNPERLYHLDRLLSTYSNCYLDTSATKWVVRELSPKPAEAREFFEGSFDASIAILNREGDVARIEQQVIEPGIPAPDVVVDQRVALQPGGLG